MLGVGVVAGSQVEPITDKYPLPPATHHQSYYRNHNPPDRAVTTTAPPRQKAEEYLGAIKHDYALLSPHVNTLTLRHMRRRNNTVI